jgi:hypothetical protein
MPTYADDKSYGGSIELDLAAVEEEAEVLKPKGQTVTMSKTKIIRGPEVTDEQVEHIVDRMMTWGYSTRESARAAIVTGATVVGVPIGDPEYIKAELKGKNAETAELCESLLHLERAAAPLLKGQDITYRVHTLIKLSLAPAITHLARAIDPEIFLPFAREHDTIIFNTAMQLYGIHESIYSGDTLLAAVLRERFFLPAKQSGCGFTSQADAARPNYIASAALTARVIAQDIPRLALETATGEPWLPPGAGADPALAQASGGQQDAAGPVLSASSAAAMGIGLHTVGAAAGIEGGGEGAQAIPATTPGILSVTAPAQAARPSTKLRYEAIFPGITASFDDLVEEGLASPSLIDLGKMHQKQVRGLGKAIMASRHNQALFYSIRFKGMTPQ